MTETNAYIRKLSETYPLREPVLRSVIRALGLREGSRGLDAGCGIGLTTLLPAEAVGPVGHVIGLDTSPALLRYAENAARKRGLSDRVSFQRGDVNTLPFDDAAFDWAWSVDCAGYPVGDLPPVLRELARVVKPGGTVAILAWSSQCFLPGYPLLEARLNATCSALTPYVQGKNPEKIFMRAPGSFQGAGLTKAEGRTFVGDVQAPLGDDLRKAMVSTFDMLWGERQPEVSAEDWREFQRLCRPDSPECILNLPDYYGFFTYSMFRGEVREA